MTEPPAKKRKIADEDLVEWITNGAGKYLIADIIDARIKEFVKEYVRRRSSPNV